MAILKLLVGVGAVGGVVVGGALSYKLGIFDGKVVPSTVKQRLKKGGYELISESSKDQWKTSFNAFKSDSSFISEINKHSDKDAILTNADDGEKGKVALEKMCNSYLKGSDDFENASKWCVLRMQDKSPSKGWLPLTDGNNDAGANKTKWESAFETHKTALSNNNIKGITTSTQKEQGHTLLKQWCTDNLPLPFNKDRASIFANASHWCSVP
ncbi:hypothetical protein MHC_02235 [Mycoplasma haemocanis str. Illinois]|uniref:Uncharacterized protein n=1 Tax=Mycoplasma haemocanis (strain Illinois) TaxID=1111676 RepID=H6N6P1_MYCHN|nr:hypothetical protein [Mycoplasma haemocanis]AEW45313.1 hypothetical protein MHC_02235 [Mycoplasma haemocanis str. Illinois]